MRAEPAHRLLQRGTHMADGPNPAERTDSTFSSRLAARLEKNLLVVLGGIVIGAFAAGMGALLFIQKTVKSEIDNLWKGQLSTLAKSAVDKHIKERFGTLEPALVKRFHAGENDCTRINDVQYCWGREARTPKWDAAAKVNTVDHTFTFAAPFEDTPVVTVGIYAAKNQKMWAVYSSNRMPKTFSVRAQDISKSPQSEEHVLVSYLAVGTPGKE
jgi:hypothetical protein